MKKRTTLIGLILILAAAIVLSQVQTISAFARKIDLRQILNLDTSVPQTSGTVTVDQSLSSPVSKDQLAKNDDVLAQAEKLIKKAEKEYLVPGWLHIYGETEAFVTASDVLPDGSPVPTHWTDDTWILLDDKGNAISAITLQDTGDPKTSQTSIYKDSVWTNLTLGIVMEPEIYSPSLDGGFFASVLPYKTTLKLSSEQVTLNDGQRAICFRSEEKYKKPLMLGKDTKNKKAQEIQGMTFTYCFSAETGVQLQIESYALDLNGNLVLTQRTIMRTVEKGVTPPAEILNYFTQ
jgi:hypothetical protein